MQAGVRVRGWKGADQADLASGQKWYEVRVDAWSCSVRLLCAAFPAAKSEVKQKDRNEVTGESVVKEVGWTFGGLTLGDDMPVCKHLLACVLVEFCGLFQGLVEESAVSVEEVAGWGAAGWGD